MLGESAQNRNLQDNEETKRIHKQTYSVLGPDWAWNEGIDPVSELNEKSLHKIANQKTRKHNETKSTIRKTENTHTLPSDEGNEGIVPVSWLLFK